MKIKPFLFSLMLLCMSIACSGSHSVKGNEVPDDTDVLQEEYEKEDLTDTLRLSSEIKPGQWLLLDSLYTDTLVFIEYDDNGDYSLLRGTVHQKPVSLVYNERSFIPLNQGDLIEIRWKMDSVRIAGEGETLDFWEWAVQIKKIKEGKVSLFKKKYTQPIEYTCEKDRYSSEFLHSIYLHVEYYLANTQNPLIVSLLKKPNAAKIVYSIEERTRKDEKYIALGIRNKADSSSTILQWLYLSLEYPHVLYEYKPETDTWIEFK